MLYVYGPVPSRRLGSSLGVNLTPFKTCSYSCVYCQLGRTTCKTVERKSFFPKEKVFEEVVEAVSKLSKAGGPDCVTFAGEGEPTLNSDLGWLLDRVNELGVRSAVITNSSLLWRKDVREELSISDICLPSLDAVSENVFRRINRPHRSLTAEKVVSGLLEFADDYEGELMLEVMLVKGYNDSVEELEKIARVASEMKPDRIHILTPTRPPASKVEPSESISTAVECFEKAGVEVDTVYLPESGSFDYLTFSTLEEAVRLMSRHPLRESQALEMVKHFGRSLKELEEIEGVEVRKFRGVRFYFYNPAYTCKSRKLEKGEGT